MKLPHQSVAALILVAASLFLASCSPGYVMRGAYEQGKILLARRDIEKVLADPSTSADDAEKLRIVLAAREYASAMGLKVGDSYTTYSDIGKDTLSWVVVGARRDSFSLYTWWFPIVGEVPYKGFFDEEDAKEQAAELQREGYETWVRGTDAFSTLGWFNDPVLSTTLKSPPTRIANTVIHESVHPTVWIKGSVPFNESLANVVAAIATQQFFESRVAGCRQKGESDCTVEESRLQLARRDAEAQLALSDSVGALYAALDEVYTNERLSTEEKLAQREAVFGQHVNPLRAAYPSLQALRQVNNAEIMQLKIYLTDLRLFKKLYEQSRGSWEAFFREIKTIEEERKRGDVSDPFQLLRNKVRAQS